MPNTFSGRNVQLSLLNERLPPYYGALSVWRFDILASVFDEEAVFVGRVEYNTINIAPRIL